MKVIYLLNKEEMLINSDNELTQSVYHEKTKVEGDYYHTIYNPKLEITYSKLIDADNLIWVKMKE